LKRLFDFIFALVLLVLFAPVILCVTVGILTIIGTPILFSQQRPGKEKKIFTIYKFRTMNNNTDINGNLLPDEARLKGFGKFIRSTSLDELPQLWNVLKGDMSFVGPRPLLIEYLPLYNETQMQRHEVRPGITGWAQVNGRNTISWEEKFRYDVEYVDKQSFLFDLKILWMTFKKVIQQDGVNQTGHVTVEKFNGNN
jgi:lipopolysaccharide/colanic/teichoic acid biosynthesis glycosyltransferase